MAAADPVVPVSVVDRFKASCQTWAASPSLLLFITAVLALGIVLVLRPPFALVFQRDIDKPWRSCASTAWFAVAVCVGVSVLVAAALPILMES